MPRLPHPLLKFIFMSTTFFFIGTVHGVLQIIPPIRSWLESIGTPLTGPGHMIDPLAHAHINMVGGVVLFLMGLSYYLLPVLSGKPLYSQRLVNHTFWWTAIGVSGFYLTLLIFGIWEGVLMLENPGSELAVHSIYRPVVATVSSVMGMGFWIYFANIFMTARSILKDARQSAQQR